MIRVCIEKNGQLVLKDITGIYYSVGTQVKMHLVDKDGNLLLDSGGNILKLTDIGNPEREISLITRCRRAVWESARACFSKNMWRGDKPWLGDEPWK